MSKEFADALDLDDPGISNKEKKEGREALHSIKRDLRGIAVTYEDDESVVRFSSIRVLVKAARINPLPWVVTAAQNAAAGNAAMPTVQAQSALGSGNADEVAELERKVAELEREVAGFKRVRQLFADATTGVVGSTASDDQLINAAKVNRKDASTPRPPTHDDTADHSGCVPNATFEAVERERNTLQAQIANLRRTHVERSVIQQLARGAKQAFDQGSKQWVKKGKLPVFTLPKQAHGELESAITNLGREGEPPITP